MAKITNIEGGRGFESNEDRLLELNTQIEEYKNRIFELHELSACQHLH